MVISSQHKTTFSPSSKRWDSSNHELIQYNRIIYARLLQRSALTEILIEKSPQYTSYLMADGLNRQSLGILNRGRRGIGVSLLIYAWEKKWWVVLISLNFLRLTKFFYWELKAPYRGRLVVRVFGYIRSWELSGKILSDVRSSRESVQLIIFPFKRIFITITDEKWDCLVLIALFNWCGLSRLQSNIYGLHFYKTYTMGHKLWTNFQIKGLLFNIFE